MRPSQKPTFVGNVRLAVGAAVVVTVASTALVGLPGRAPSSTPVRTSQSSSEDVNLWAAGDLAVARYLAAQTTGASALPDLTDPAVRHQFACSFAAGSFGLSTEGTDGDGRSSC